MEPAIGGDTPIADAYFTDRFRDPGGVHAWARETERALRALAARVGDAPLAFRTRELDEVAARLADALLDDPRRGELRRALERPARQLVPGTPGRARLDELRDDLARGADRALAVGAEVDALHRDVAALRGAYGEAFPHFTAEHLRLARLEDADLAAIRTALQVEAARERRAGVAALLARCAAASADSDALLVRDPLLERALAAAVGGAELTDAELAALTRIRLAQRRATARVLEIPEDLRALSLRHLLALDASLGDDRVPGGPASAALRALARADLARPAAAAREPEETLLWFGATSAVGNAVHPVPGRFAWRPAGAIAAPEPAPHEEAPADDAAIAVLRVLWIGGAWLCLAPELDTPVRVWSAAVGEGREVECTVQAPGATVADPGAARRDLDPLFAGLLADRPAWYRVAHRARVRLVRQVGGRWYGQVVHPGALAVLDAPPAREEPPAPGAFRVLGDAAPGAAEEDARDIVIPAGPPRRGYVLDTEVVRTALAEHPVAWLRAGAQGERSAARAAAEEALFAALEARRGESGGAPLALRPVGHGRLPRHRTRFPLHAVPAAVPAFDPGVAGWIRASEPARLATLRGVARIINVAHECGWVLGACALDMFAFGAAWESLDEPPLPAPLLVAAPLATPIGAQLHAPPWPGDMPGRTHERIGVPVLQPAVEHGVTARTDVDARAFAVFALEVLAEVPTGPTLAATWDDVVDIALGRRLAVRFSQPAIARAIGLTLWRPDSDDQLYRALRVLVRAPDRPLERFYRALVG